MTRLTEHGFTVGGPRFALDGRLYYSIVNPHAFPALLVRDPGASASRKVANRYLGTRVGFAASEIVFDQMEIENQVGLQSDLYAVGAGGHTRRLTHGARAGDPDVSPDGSTIVCTVQRADRRELATLPVPAGRTQDSSGDAGIRAGCALLLAPLVAGSTMDRGRTRVAAGPIGNRADRSGHRTDRANGRVVERQPQRRAGVDARRPSALCLRPRR